MKKIPNLDTLRFIAAFLVIIHHIEIYKSFFSLDNNSSVAFFSIIGKLGVVLFFVLSGFLITTLLLNEKEKNGCISLTKFYARRMLRIWPVYYLIIGLGFFVFPHFSFFAIPDVSNFTSIAEVGATPIVYYYLLIFANIGLMLFGNIAYTSQTWSLATEEQFYLIWPILIATFSKRLLSVMVLIIIFYHAMRFFSSYLPSPYGNYLYNFLYYFDINCMAIGGVAALLIHKKSIIIKLIFNSMLFYLTVIGTFMLLIFGVQFGFFHYDVYAILFTLIISNLAFNPSFANILENKVTNYLGQISYGIYMFHLVAITIAIKLAINIEANWIIYPITFVLTILFSHLSFKYFEMFFLRLKERFVVNN